MDGLYTVMKLTAGSLVKFGQAFFPDTFSKAPARFHHELSSTLIGSKESTVMCFPRESGKSTYVETLFAWNILHQKHNYILLIGSTAETAEASFGNAVKNITSHPLLSSIIDVKKNTSDSFFFNIGDKHFFYKCKSAGSQLRGTRYEQYRPSLIICDDLEKTESVESIQQRKKLRDWFFSDAIPLGKEAQFIFVGTFLHNDCLLANLESNPPVDLRNSKRWKTFRYGVMDERGAPTWPEQYSAEWIEKKRKDMTAQGQEYRFLTEYMNQVSDSKTAMYHLDDIRFFQAREYNYASDDILICVDPGISKNTDRDPTAIAVTAMDSVGNFRVLEIVRAHMELEEILFTITSLYKKYKPRMTFIEAVAAQEYLFQCLQDGTWRGNLSIPVEKMPSRMVMMGKSRIDVLAKTVKQKKLMIPYEADWWDMLWEEMQGGLRAKNDDMSDCLAYSCMLSEQPTNDSLTYSDFVQSAQTY